MTDQGPTMPQFSEQVAQIRETLLPSVIESWADLPPDVQSTCKEFGTFYCKMHPIIDFAEEVNNTLKSYKDIATSGKKLHTLLTAETRGDKVCTDSKQGLSPPWVQRVGCGRQIFQVCREGVWREEQTGVLCWKYGQYPVWRGFFNSFKQAHHLLPEKACQHKMLYSSHCGTQLNQLRMSWHWIHFMQCSRSYSFGRTIHNALWMVTLVSQEFAYIVTTYTTVS